MPGTKIVPDLATSIPVPTNGGKTYVFHIRTGIKFSNGQTLKPSDFVRTFERQFTVPGPTTFYSGLVGASKCSAKHCDLSKGVVANDSAYTLTLNLTAPDPEIMDQLALPFAYVVPGRHLAEADREQRAAGHRARTCGSRTTRTPRRCWSATRTSSSGAPRRQPAGYPNEIIEKYGLQVSDEVTEVQNGQANEVFDGDQIPSDRLTELNSPQYASQVHVNTADRRLVLRAEHPQPPFNNLQARQAINYAANRAAYVKIGGGPSLAVPACQILPPNFPVLQAVLPVHRRADTTIWSGPDLAKAKELVKASGTAGHEGRRQRHHRRGGQGAGRADGLRPELDRLQGQRSAADRRASSTRSSRTPPTPASGTSAWSAWYQDYPAPSDFLNVLLGCGSIHPGSDASPNIAAFCNKSIQAQITRPRPWRPTNPAGASEDLDAGGPRGHRRRRPGSTCTTPSRSTSCPRASHGYQWNPQWYILIDQLWLSK